jgi:hypothetical protein
MIHLRQQLALLYPIGGSPHTPELQVGQLTSEGSLSLELLLKKEEKTLFGLLALHLGQLRLDPSWPMAWRTSNFSPQSVH